MTTFSTKTICIIIFAAALGMRLVALVSFDSEQSLFYVADSYHYVQVAKNLIEHGVYSMEISDAPHPDNFRTPLYPLFLLPFVWLGTSFYTPVVAQILIVSGGMAIIYLLARRVFDEKVAAIGALLFALEPFGALINVQLLTEAIFIPLFVSAILLFMHYAKTRENKSIYVGSILLAFAGLTRPISFYLFIFIPILVLVANHKKIAWKTMGFSLGLFFLVVSPWVAFNAVALHTPVVSSISNLQLYEYYGRYFDAWRGMRGATDRLLDISLDPVNKTFNARAIPPIAAIGRAYLLDHAGEYALYHISRLPALFTDSGYASILNGVPGLHFYLDTSNSGGFFDQIELRHLERTIEAIREQPVIVLLLFADLAFILITILAVLNPYLHWRKDRAIPKEIIFVYLLLGAYTVIASPIGGARFRIPINIFLFLLAITSIRMSKRESYDD